MIKQILTTSNFTVQTLLRSKRAVAVLILYLIWVLAAGVFVVWLEQKTGNRLHALKDMPDLKKLPMANDFFHLLHGNAKDVISNIIKHPLFISAYLFLNIWALPGIIALASFDIINSDLRSKFIRFEALRASRKALLFGKTLAHWLMIAATTLIATLVLFAYGLTKLSVDQVLPAWPIMLGYWLITLILGFSYLALTVLVSSLVDRGVLALILIWIVSGLLNSLAFNHYVGFLSPSWYTTGLFSGHLTVVATDMLIFAGFGALYLLLAFLRIQRRDM